ncbi:MAG: diaminopimelate epimerase [Candidatus Krumholzibacteriota bacterium]|nr:diaminopimelate epimerase [Candidatus Krumholzibacteriota bacterium]
MNDVFHFVKMHGAGNDFVMINDPELRFKASSRLISALCRDHTGIGADGLILIRHDEENDFRMRYFNKDGGEAEMCGNGARCAAMFAYMNRITGKKMSFSTGAGTVKAEILEKEIRIGLGEVNGYIENLELEDSAEKTGFAICGVPHAAMLTDDTKSWEENRFLALARSVRYDPALAPEGANFNLVSIVDKHSLVYRTYERGVESETLACGTGAAAVSVITSKMGLTASPVRCETSGGGLLQVEFTLNEDGASECYLTGPAVATFEGRFSISAYDQ